MKRWILFIGIAFLIVVILITLILVVFDRDKEKAPVAVINLTGNWQTVDHPTYGISFSVPTIWDVGVFESGKGRVSGSLRSGDTVTYLDINLLTIDNPNEEDLLDSVLPFVGEKIKQGGLSGISYVGKVIEEGGEEWDGEYEDSESISPGIHFSDDSYIEGRKLIVSMGTIDAKCMTVGKDYASYISICSDILNSIRGI